MNSIVEIHPKELKFVVELKKQISSCSVRLTNTTDHHVAIKVKTTSPKKYCVLPSVGVIRPRSAREFSVYLQAQRALDVKCTDKFLFQSTIISAGTTDSEITASLFSKDDGKHIEEQKLRVIIMSSPDSDLHILSPIKVDLNQGQGHESIYDQVLGGVEKLIYSRDLSQSSLRYQAGSRVEHEEEVEDESCALLPKRTARSAVPGRKENVPGFHHAAKPSFVAAHQLKEKFTSKLSVGSKAKLFGSSTIMPR